MSDAVRKPVIPKQWQGQEDGEHWNVIVEHDCMAEGEPLIVTVEVENSEVVPNASGGDSLKRESYSLACMTPDQAREMASALHVYAFMADEQNRPIAPTQPIQGTEGER